MNKLPIMSVDLGEYGIQEVNFNECVKITQDITTELHDSPALYAWIASVRTNLETQLKLKKIKYESLKGERSSIITDEILASGKKATGKAVDAELANDDSLIRFNEEMLVLEDQIANLKDLITTLHQKHEVLHELSRRELKGFGMTFNEVKVEKEEKAEPHRVEKETSGKSKRGRKTRKTEDET